MPPKVEKHRCQIIPRDVLSSLPDDLINVILMCLPLRDAMRTSILSKEWRYNWCRLSVLTLDQTFWGTTNNSIFPSLKFANIMFHLLTLHEGPISKFTLSVPKYLEPCSSKIDNLIHLLSRKDIQYLALQFSKQDLYKLPSSFFTCSQLSSLSLQNCIVCPSIDFKGFQGLISLELRQVKISAESLGCLISYSPLLEHLVLRVSNILNRIQINAPKLRSFQFVGKIEFVCFTNVPLLSKLSLVDIDCSNKAKKIDLERFFQSFPVLEHLYLDYYNFSFLFAGSRKVPRRLSSVLNSLKCLHLTCNSLDEVVDILAALCLIRSSPYLQEIEFEVYHFCWPDELLDPVTSDDVDEIATSFSDVTLNHLRTVKFKGIIGSMPEMELIKLLLDKSPMLLRMIIEPEQGDESSETRLKKLAEVTKFRRASPKAEVLYIIN